MNDTSDPLPGAVESLGALGPVRFTAVLLMSVGLADFLGVGTALMLRHLGFGVHELGFTNFPESPTLA